MYRLLHRHVLLPAFETGIKRRQTFRYWSELERTQWLPRPRLEELQQRSLQRLIQHAVTYCPYYRDAWLPRGLKPDRLQTLADFQAWPVIDRETVRHQRMGMRARLPGLKLYSKSTGGSSGAPVHFDLDAGSNDWRTAAWHRGYAWAGAGPGSKQFYLWGVPLGARPLWRRCKDALYNRFQRRLVVSSFELRDALVPAVLARLNRYRPDVIVAYANPLYYFARALKEAGLVPVAPHSIVVGAEKLHDFQRRLIEEVFRAPVFETYGSREVMLIGAECDRHEGLHLTSEVLYVEILDDAGRPAAPGEEGDVVVTDLHNLGMPFIRYRNGDRAVAGWGTCSCGRGLPLLRRVVGRRLDLLDTPDGRHVPGEFFPHLLKDFPEVRRFQVTQDRLDWVRLRVVVPGGWRAGSLAVIEKEARRVLGPAVRFEVEPVPDIPLTPAGKLQVVVNRSNAHAH